MARERMAIDIQYHLQSDTLIIQFGEHVFDMPASIVHGFANTFKQLADQRIENGFTDTGPVLTEYRESGRLS